MKNTVLCLISLLTMIAFQAHSQAIKGIVHDQNNQPLIGVTIQLKNTQKGTQTDASGNYSISQITKGSYTLVFSYIGYKTQEVVVTVSDNATTTVPAITLYEGNEILERILQ